MNIKDYDGRKVLVTGASSGLGQAIAIGAAKRGAHSVVINYSSNLKGAETTADEVRSFGANAILVQGNVGEDADCRKIAEAAKTLGHIDSLFNNAGITVFAINHADLDAVSASDFQKLYQVNVVGAFQMVRACRSLLEAGPAIGAVVNVSSLASVNGIGSSIPYATSKGALNILTFSLARALAPKIRVNALCPGYIDTPWYDDSNDQGRRQRMRENAIATTPLRVASSSEDTSEVALFLGSEQSRHITGETLLADAGTHLGMNPVKQWVDKKS